MGDYDRRITELNDLLGRAAEGADERAVRALRDCIKEWGEEREEHLEMIADIAERASPENKDSQKKWQERAARARADVSKLFGDAVKDLILPAPLQLFWATALAQEDAFWKSLGEVATPKLHDDILAHQKGLSQLIAELEEKWKMLLSKHQVFESDEMKAVAQVQKIVDEIIKELDPWHKAAREKAAKVQLAVSHAVEKVHKKLGANVVVEFGKKIFEEIVNVELPGEADPLIESALAHLDAYSNGVAQRIGAYRAQVAIYKSLLQAENGSVLHLFKRTRDDVDKYLDKNDLPKAQVWRDQARGFLSDWARARPTAGQQDDAEKLHEAVWEHIEADWKISEELDKQFRGRWTGVFVAPLGRETIEELTEKHRFEEEVKRLNDGRAADRLKALASSLPGDIEDDLDKVLKSLEEAADDVPAEVRDFARRESEEFEAYVRKRFKERIERLLPVIDELQRTFAPSSVAEDFSREVLEDSLD